MPRVAFYSPRAAPLFDPASTLGHGGAELDVFHYATWIARGHPSWEVHVMLAHGPQSDGAVVTTADGVVLHPCYHAGRRGNALVVPLGMRRWLARIDPDVVFQESAGAETGLLQAWCARQGRGFVYRVAHDVDCTGEYLQWSWLRGRLFRRGLLRADRVLAQTPVQQQMLRETFGLESGLVRNAHPPIEAPPLPYDARHDVLWIGRFETWKRVERVLDLARRLPDLAFSVVGRIEGPVALALQAEAATLANVEMPGEVPFSTTPARFARALALVNTSQYEGFPNTYVQALRAGTPIVSLAVDPEGWLATGEVGLHAHDDIDAMAAGLARLASDRAEHDRLATAAQARFRSDHDLDVVVTGLVDELAAAVPAHRR